MDPAAPQEASVSCSAIAAGNGPDYGVPEAIEALRVLTASEELWIGRPGAHCRFGRS
jgi:hypothetical protein